MLPRPFIVGILSLAAATVLQAQEPTPEPFAQDIVPTFSFSETYIEVLETLQADDGSTEYLPVPSKDSKTTVKAKLSASGVPFASFTAETPVSLTIGSLSISGVLGDDPTYVPGTIKGSVRIPIMDLEVTDENPDGTPIEVGQAVVSWNDKEINISIVVTRAETYQVAASDYIGYEPGKLEEESTTCQFALGNHALTDRTVYLQGRVDYRKKKVGPDEEFDLASITISGAIDSARPKVRIVGLKNNEIVGTAEFDVEAIASDNSAVADVQVQVNEDEYISLVEGDNGRWIAEGLELTYGANTIRVKAIDDDGNESIIAESALRFWASLNITVSGKGSVTKGFAGTSLREPDAQLSVKATPANGYIFTGWSGDITSSSPTLPFTMVQPGVALTANFIPNPFTALKGSYSGIIAPGVGSTGAGSLDVQLTGAGSFTAKLGLNGQTKTLSGSFDHTGYYTGTLDLGNGTSLAFNLQLGLGENANAISGTVSDGTNTFNISSERGTYSAKNPAPQAGYYTVALPAGAPETPQGDGYATLKVAVNGAATLTGALQDGTTFSYGGSVSRDGNLGVYFTPYGGKGTVYGVLTFPEEAEKVGGTLSWVKAPGATTDNFYPEGFTTETEVVGGVYVAPRAQQRVIELANTTLNAKVTVGEGGINGPIEKVATLNTANKVAVVADAATDSEVGKVKVNITPKTGLFSGSFVDSTGTQRKFNGVFLQDRTLGTGVFRGLNTAGYVRIAAPSVVD